MTPTIERMNDRFAKLHLAVGRFAITLHHFTGPDIGDPHDHPYPFTTTILAGGYVEEVWRRGRDGGWSSRLVHREVGSSHRVGASSIHRIVELPQGECVTSVVWHAEGVKRREPRFYRLRRGVMQSRRWDQPRYKSAARPKRPRRDPRAPSAPR